MKPFPSCLAPIDRPLTDEEGLDARAVRECLRGGGCPSDDEFDRHLTPEARGVSNWFWTPVAVARQAASWLSDFGARSVMDIGSGAGKFCVVAAASAELQVVGLEHRPNLVMASRSLAQRCGVAPRVTFVDGALGRVPLPRVDAYYFFNPFGENLFGSKDCLDEEVVLTSQRYWDDLAATEALLDEAPVGTLVITYNGIGMNLPPTFVLRRVDRELPCLLKLYEKIDCAADTERECPTLPADSVPHA